MLLRSYVLLVLLSASEFAWGQCPYGMPNNPGCVPPDAWPQNQGGSTVVQHQPYWIYTWGAIATGKGREPYVLATVTGLDSEKEARKAVINKCVELGGIKKTCNVEITYHHQCAAFAGGMQLPGGSSAARAVDIETASRLAMEQCKEITDECEIFYSACTEPYLIK